MWISKLNSLLPKRFKSTLLSRPLFYQLITHEGISINENLKERIDNKEAIVVSQANWNLCMLKESNINLDILSDAILVLLYTRSNDLIDIKWTSILIVSEEDEYRLVGYLIVTTQQPLNNANNSKDKNQENQSANQNPSHLELLFGNLIIKLLQSFKRENVEFALMLTCWSNSGLNILSSFDSDPDSHLNFDSNSNANSFPISNSTTNIFDDYLEKILLKSRDNQDQSLIKSKCLAWKSISILNHHLMTRETNPSILISIMTRLEMEEISREKKNILNEINNDTGHVNHVNHIHDSLDQNVTNWLFSILQELLSPSYCHYYNSSQDYRIPILITKIIRLLWKIVPLELLEQIPRFFPVNHVILEIYLILKKRKIKEKEIKKNYFWTGELPRQLWNQDRWLSIKLMTLSIDHDDYNDVDIDNNSIDIDTNTNHNSQHNYDDLIMNMDIERESDYQVILMALRACTDQKWIHRAIVNLLQTMELDTFYCESLLYIHLTRIRDNIDSSLECIKYIQLTDERDYQGEIDSFEPNKDILNLIIKKDKEDCNDYSLIQALRDHYLVTSRYGLLLLDCLKDDDGS